MQLTEHVGVKMDPQTKGWLDTLATATGRSRSAVIRQLVQSAELPQRPDIRAARGWHKERAGLAGGEVEHDHGKS